MAPRDELTRTEERVTERVVEERETITWYVCPNCGEDHLTVDDIVPVTLGVPLPLDEDAKKTYHRWVVVSYDSVAQTILCEYCAESIWGDATVGETWGDPAAGYLDDISPGGMRALVEAARRDDVGVVGGRPLRNGVDLLAERLALVARWLWAGLVVVLYWPALLFGFASLFMATGAFVLGLGLPSPNTVGLVAGLCVVVGALVEFVSQWYKSDTSGPW